MSYDYEYPYYDPSKFNVDWLLKKIKEIDETVLGLETYTYEGENKVLDLNDLRANSIASFTSNYNVLNSPVSNVRRIVTTEGSETGGMQKLYNLASMETYTRNYTVSSESYTWSSWVVTDYKPDTIMRSITVITNQNIDDMPPNTVTFVIGGGSQSNRPTNYNAYIIDWKSEGSVNRIQLWIDKGDQYIYIRFYSGTWTNWFKTNPIDYTNIMKLMNVSTPSIGELAPNKFSQCNFKPSQTWAGAPQAVYFKFDGGIWYGICTSGMDMGRLISVSSNSDIITTPLHNLPKYSVESVADLPIQSQCFVYITKEGLTEPKGYGMAFRYSTGFNESRDSTFLNLNFDGSIYMARSSASNPISTWYKFQSTTTRALVANTYTMNERERTSVDDMYTALPHNLNRISSPGQSFFRHDEGEQSFLESILSYDDIESFDNITSNLEMWDMEVPLEEMVSSLTSFINELSSLAPLTEFTLFSLPPVDVPFFGDELYTFEWPNGATLLEIDKTLHELASELGFNYVDFQSYKYINNTALLDTYGEELFSKKVYKNQLSKYVASNF